MIRFTSAVSALQASQRALETIGNNIANSNTPGYHRQITDLANRSPYQIQGLSIGQGVEISEIRRARSDVLEAATTRQAADAGAIDARLEGLTRLESELSTEAGTPASLIVDLFNK